jgi:hypothetical protein
MEKPTGVSQSAFSVVENVKFERHAERSEASLPQ